MEGAFVIFPIAILGLVLLLALGIGVGIGIGYFLARRRYSEDTDIPGDLVDSKNPYSSPGTRSANRGSSTPWVVIVIVLATAGICMLVACAGLLLVADSPAPRGTKAIKVQPVPERASPPELPRD